MQKILRLLVPGLLILVLISQSHADIITIEVTIKSVDAKDRTITATRKGKTLELDVSKNAQVNINGKASELAALAAGQTAKIDYETNLEIITKVEASGEARPAPELLVLREINSPSFDGNLSFMPDGLTVYWQAKVDDGPWIWTAKRKTPNSLFEDKKKIMPGADPTVSSDGLEMILAQDGKLHSATRASLADSFQRPRAIPEFSKYGFRSNAGRLAVPHLSEDGLTLYMNYFHDGSGELVMATRQTRTSPWSSLQNVPGLNEQPAAFPFVTGDGRMLFCTNTHGIDGSDQSNFLIYSREKLDEPFQFSGLVDCPVLRQGGLCPKFCKATGELFFAGIVEGGESVDLMVVKNFSPTTMIQKDADPFPKPGDDLQRDLLGKWEEDRRQGLKNYREFRSNGNFTFTGALKKNFSGKWRIEGKKVFYKTSQDQEEVTFEVLKVEKDRLTILMKGERAYTWKRVK